MQKFLSLVVFFLPFFFALNPSENVDLSLIRLLPFVLFFLWLRNGWKNKTLSLDKRPIFWFWLLFLGLSSPSFLWAENPAWSLRKSFFLISFLPFYLFAYSFFHKKNPSLLFQAFFHGALLSAFLGIIQFTSSLFWGLDASLLFWNKFQAFFLGRNFSSSVINYPSFLVNISGENFLRAFGSFPDPHLFGAFLALSLPFGFWCYQKKPSQKLLWGLSLILIACLLSFSRTVYLMLLVELSFLTFLFLKKQALLKVLFLLLLFFLPLFLLINNPLKQRLFSSLDFQEGSVSGRLLMWEKATQAFQEKPLLGVGLGNFPLFVKPTAAFREPIYAHNLFLDFLAETGLFSAFSLLFIFGLAILNNLFSSLPEKKALSVFFLGFLIYALFEAPFFSLQLYPLFLIFLAL